LIGDPCQLGPIIRSLFAKKHQYHVSLLESLIKVPLYQRNMNKFTLYGGYHPNYITKLVKNYRSHPAILHIYSHLFYDNDLLPYADQTLTKSLCPFVTELFHLPNDRQYPIIFHGIEGKDRRENNSPSWFNPDEITVVFHYLKKLLEYRKSRLTFNDIGVITPYQKQVQKLKTLFQAKNMEGIKVGSVEEFQGQERRVIIISTVRSSQKFIDSDIKRNLGFLKNEKRFNVAVSRAQALLITIGNPKVLMKDFHWATLIASCRQNETYTGCEFNETEEEELTTYLDQSDNEISEDSEWRSNF